MDNLELLTNFLDLRLTQRSLIVIDKNRSQAVFQLPGGQHHLVEYLSAAFNAWNIQLEGNAVNYRNAQHLQAEWMIVAIHNGKEPRSPFILTMKSTIDTKNQPLRFYQPPEFRAG